MICYEYARKVKELEESQVPLNYKIKKWEFSIEYTYMYMIKVLINTKKYQWVLKTCAWNWLTLKHNT